MNDARMERWNLIRKITRIFRLMSVHELKMVYAYVSGYLSVKEEMK